VTITMTPTSKIVELNGVPARIWEGTTDKGTPCVVFVTRVAVSNACPPDAHAAFREALQETKPPSVEVQAIPLRLIL